VKCRQKTGEDEVVVKKESMTRWSLVAEMYGILNDQLCSSEDLKLKGGLHIGF